MKNKSLKRNYSLKFKAYPNFESRTVCFLLLVLACAASLSNAQTSKELDPTNLLLSDLNENTQKTSKTTIPMQPNIAQSVLSSQSQTIDIAPLNFASQVQQAGLDIPNTSHNVKQKLLKTDMTLFKTDNNMQKFGLQKIIEQINSVEFRPSKKTPESIVVIEPTVISESNETSIDIEEQEKYPESQPIRKTNNISQKLQALSQDRGKPENPFELAEILFLAGHLKESAVFYEQALEQIKTEDPKSILDRAWVLFQIGNCLKTEDPKTAKEMYRQLITEYPDSIWTNLAKTQDKIINWYQTDKPKELIKEISSDLK